MRMGEGIVKKLEPDNMVKIEVREDSMYKASETVDSFASVYVHALNDIGAQKGDLVRYEMEDRHMGRVAFMAFGLPLLIMFLAGFIVGGSTDNLAYGIIAGIIGLAASVIGVKYYDRSLGRVLNTQPRLIEIVDAYEKPEEKQRKYTEYAAMDVLQRNA